MEAIKLVSSLEYCVGIGGYCPLNTFLYRRSMFDALKGGARLAIS
jgi:hypothetical protein